jgi:hypothetical protein
MKIISEKQLHGEYGTVPPHTEFEAREETGNELIRMGYARHVRPPKVQYETKVVTPAEAPEVSAREPFRDVPHVDEESAGVGTEGHKVLRSDNIFESGTSDSRGRGRRKGSDSGE